MDPMSATAASGLNARMESLDLLANNIANASTGGYKADREFYSLYVAPEAEESNSPTAMPLIQKAWIDLSQGMLQATGNSLDVALNGKGFFSVAGPNGPLYTRDGGFHLAPDGKLVNAEGYAVRSTAGDSLTAQSALPLEIEDDGTLMQDGQTLGKLDIADFSGAAGLAKQGNNYFRVTDPSIKPSVPAATSVEQGKREASNTGTAESAIRLVNIMRQFEMLQKAMVIGSDMSKQAIEQVAKV